MISRDDLDFDTKDLLDRLGLHEQLWVLDISSWDHWALVRSGKTLANDKKSINEKVCSVAKQYIERQKRGVRCPKEEP